MKKFILALIGILILIIENSISNYISIFDIRINIMIIYMSIISLYLDELEAGIIGTIIGIVKDISIGSIFGANAFIMFAVGYLISHMRTKIYKESYLTIFALVFIGSLIDSIINATLLGQVYANNTVLTIAYKGFLSIPFLNSICGILFYFIFKKWISKLKRE